MRWPSVYVWGWIMLPGRLFILIGAVVFAGLLQLMFPETNIFPWAVFASFVALAAVSLMLTACPRCWRSVYQRSQWRANTLWPVSECSRCGLDLKKFGPFDRRAKVPPRMSA
ncbi:hypothetical protein BrevBR_15420 [Brevundimonas sp. BR2-1]|uniref:hypothetical protein n=1 Tax=Brevundimonas sp. BR2-1 TaxID=3031123 RepID=UPI003094F310